jgi:hypothetical protein
LPAPGGPSRVTRRARSQTSARSRCSMARPMSRVDVPGIRVGSRPGPASERPVRGPWLQLPWWIGRADRGPSPGRAPPAASAGAQRPVQTEVIEQPAATLDVGVEGLGLEAGSIESKHQQLPASLSIRLLCRQLTGLGDQLGRPAMVELQGEQFLPEPLDQLFEAARPRSWPQAGRPGRPAVGRATGRVLR